MKLREISIKFIPLDDMRWHGLGDYLELNQGIKQIYVADTGNELYNRYIATHELVEDTALVAHNIPVKAIDDYCDKVYAEGGSPDSVNTESPIHKEHMFADLIERQLTFFCGTEAKTYDDDIEKLYEPKNEYTIKEVALEEKWGVISDIWKEQLLELETRCFPECIQEDWEGIEDGLKDSEVVLFAYDEGKIIGSIICGAGEPVDLNDPDYQENKEDWDHLNALYKYMKPENGIYVNSVAVLPEYEGKGIGQSLIKAAIESSKAKGFRAMYCHANEGQSAHLFKKFGGQVIATRNNWFATEHNYSVIRINLED